MVRVGVVAFPVVVVPVEVAAVLVRRATLSVMDRLIPVPTTVLMPARLVAVAITVLKPAKIIAVLRPLVGTLFGASNLEVDKSFDTD